MKTSLICGFTILHFLLLTKMAVCQDEPDEEEEEEAAEEETDSPDSVDEENKDDETSTSNNGLTDGEIIKAILVLNSTRSKNGEVNQPILNALLNVLANRAEETVNSEVEEATTESEVATTESDVSSTTPILTYDISKIIGQVGDIVVRATHANLSSLGDNGLSASNQPNQKYTSVQSVMSGLFSSFTQWAGGVLTASNAAPAPASLPDKMAVAGNHNRTQRSYYSHP